MITGASGVLGWSLCSVAARSWETHGTFCRHPVDLPGVQMYRLDLADRAAVAKLFRAIRPDAVVHAAALSSPDYCQAHADESAAVNVDASANIASLCAEFAVPLVFTSSDLVFDGENAPYSEDAPARPLSIYGAHKLHAEASMRARYPDTTVCRLPLMFGPGSPVADGSMKHMLRQLASGREVKLFVDEIRTPVSTETAAQGLLLALEKARGATLHLGGPERLSRWDFGHMIADVFRADKSRLIPCRQKDVLMAAPRPRDVSLDSARTASIGYSPWSIREQLEFVRACMPEAVRH